MEIITVWSMRGESETNGSYKNRRHMSRGVYNSYSVDFVGGGNNPLTSGKNYANSQKHGNSLLIL